MNTLNLHASIVAAAALVASAAQATSDFNVNWYSIDGGTSVTSSGGTLALVGAIGQPDCGQSLVGATFEFAGGFLSACTSAINACPADLTGNDVVDAADLAVLLSAWGTCEQCDADISGDGIVNAADLAELLSSWGPCLD